MKINFQVAIYQCTGVYITYFATSIYIVKSMKIKCHRNYKFRPLWRSTKFYYLKNFLPYNILFKPMHKERESIFIDKIMSGYRKQYMIGQAKLTCI